MLKYLTENVCSVETRTHFCIVLRVQVSSSLSSKQLTYEQYDQKFMSESREH